MTQTVESSIIKPTLRRLPFVPILIGIAAIVLLFYWGEAAGTIFGLARGVAFVFVGATLGSAAAFLVARYVARRAIERRIEGNRKFAAIDRAMLDGSNEGFVRVHLKKGTDRILGATIVAEHAGAPN